MKIWCNLAMLGIGLLHGLAAQAEVSAPSGLELQYRDTTVRPQDDLYSYTSGKWLKETELPSDRGSFGAFDVVNDRAELQVRAIIEELVAKPNLTPGTDAAKIADLYRSFMDEAHIEALDDQPLKPLFARIDALKDHGGLPVLLGTLHLEGVTVPIDFGVQQDARNSTRYVVDITQSGLGLPDRDYYLKDDDEQLKAFRQAYLKHVARALGLAGIADADRKAARIVSFETELAKLQWTKVELRDPVKTYNKFARTDLAKLAPGFDFDAFLNADEVPLAKVDYVTVDTPSFITAASKLLADTPIDVLKDYLKWQTLRTEMPLLSKRFVDADFDFYSRTLRDIPENRPRWKRGVGQVESALGEALGRIYVERHFPPSAKARMDALVGNLLAAYRKSIDGLSWMSAPTRAAAQEKLTKLTVKIGYPKTWRDYGALDIIPGDPTGNARRAALFETRRQLAKLGKPVDHDEWMMTPQTVNAYYDPMMNEIVFPAAILQPPFFNFEADDAVNYGAIGAVIGHEISHGFDDQGSQFDADGNLRDWWTPEDHKQFDERTGRLVAQYDRQEPVKGHHVNGKLTLGENIADNSGLAITYKAYVISLNGKPAPVIDGLTGAQRLYMGFAGVWRGKVRESQLIMQLEVDPHSPEAVRGSIPLVNQPGFYEAFGLKPGDKLYLPPDERVTIW